MIGPCSLKIDHKKAKHCEQTKQNYDEKYKNIYINVYEKSELEAKN